MMKKMSFLLFALVAINMLFPSIYPAFAITYPNGEAKGCLNGIVWYFYTYDTFNSPPTWSFNAKDVVRSSVVASYSIGNTLTYVKPLLIILDSYHNIVWLIFNPKDIPKAQMDRIYIEGSLKNGDTFYATGPGPMWRKGGG